MASALVMRLALSSADMCSCSRSHAGVHLSIVCQQVVHVGHDCDLALLRVIEEEDEFFDGLHPLFFGGIPHLQEEIRVVGYPEGGENISITQGIVSRVAVAKYSHGGEKLLAVQIDAAINSGNSGGPAMGVKTNRVLGVAFETLEVHSSSAILRSAVYLSFFLLSA